MTHDLNAKYAHGQKKRRYSVVPKPAIDALADVMRNGADKYTAYNWRLTGVDIETYYDAARRHLEEYFDGQDLDADSGLHPLAHVMACCAIVIDAEAEGVLHDNRPKTSRRKESNYDPA